jgi:hypothetical protein
VGAGFGELSGDLAAKARRAGDDDAPALFPRAWAPSSGRLARATVPPPHSSNYAGVSAWRS